MQKLSDWERCKRILDLYPGSFDLKPTMVYLKKEIKGVMYYDPIAINSPRMRALLDSEEKRLNVQQLP